MKTLGVVILASAVFGVGAVSARPDDPEPPPPVKVSNPSTGVTVKVKSGKGGPLLVIDAGKAKGTGSFQLTLPEKSPPAKITLRFTNTDNQFPVFALMGKEAKSDRILLKLQAQGKETVHFGANGKELPGEKGARLSLTYESKKDEVEIVMVRHKDQEWPKAPLRVLWTRAFGKKKA